MKTMYYLYIIPSKFSEIFFRAYSSNLYSVTGWCAWRALFLVGITVSTLPAPHKSLLGSSIITHLPCSALVSWTVTWRECPLSNARNDSMMYYSKSSSLDDTREFPIIQSYETGAKSCWGSSARLRMAVTTLIALLSILWNPSQIKIKYVIYFCFLLSYQAIAAKKRKFLSLHLYQHSSVSLSLF